MSFLNIYGQTTWHDDVRIVGTEEDLTQLRFLIDSALTHKACSSDFYDSEGEGYTIKVVVATEEEGKDLRSPATDHSTLTTESNATTKAIDDW